MVWISVDELLEKVMLKLYQRWDAGALARLRPWLDEERLRLGTALRALASAHVTQSEDAIVLFLERLASQEPIMAMIQEDLEVLPEVKQAIMRARRPSMRLRGYRAKPTNLNPARVQVLVSLLEALDPPAYAVTRMYFPGEGGALTEILEYVVVQIYGNWGRLALETRDAVLRTLNTVRAGMVWEENRYTVNVRNVVEALHQFEAMPETLYYSRHAFIDGKLDTPPETPAQLNSSAPISDRLAELLANPPALAPGQPEGGPALPQPEREPQQETPTEEPPQAEQPQEGEVEQEPVQTAPEQAPAGSIQQTVGPISRRTERSFYTDVRFPQQVRVGDEVPLIVRLTRAPFAATRAAGEVAVGFDQLDRPEYVEVVVVAQGFNEETATWSRTIAVYSDRDSQPAIFLLRAGRELGEKRVSVDFYHKSRYLGSAAFATRVVEQTSAAVAGVTLDNSGLVARFVDQPPPPADLELRIVRGGSDNQLYFMLHSTKAGVGYHWRPMGQVRLNAASPQAYLETVFAHLGQLAAKPVDQLGEADAQVGKGDIDAIGQQLFRDLFPPELQHEYWTRIRPRRKDGRNPNGTIGTLLITSDEPWIPWEMVKPFSVDPDTGEQKSDAFLCENFQVARWLAGRGPVDVVNVQAASIVVPGHDLFYTQREEAYFRELLARQVQVTGPLRSLADFRRLAQNGGVQLLHFAAHGRFDANNANLSPLSLEDGALTPHDLMGDRVAGLRKERPLVFLNACHTARLAFTLTDLGEWAERMVGDVGASAFIGTQWEVNDLLAAEFAVVFYDRLLAGETLGRAFHQARLHVRDRQPANPTWLAYVLYGDPNSSVRWGVAEPSEEAPYPQPSLLPAPDFTPEPGVDVEDLRAVLEATLAGSLQELMRRSIPDAVATALELWRGEPTNGAHPGAETGLTEDR